MVTKPIRTVVAAKCLTENLHGCNAWAHKKNACNAMITHYEHQFSLPRAPLLNSAPPFYGDMPPDQAPFNDNSFCELVRHLSIACMVSWCHYVVIPPWLVDVTMLSFLHVCAAASWCHLDIPHCKINSCLISRTDILFLYLWMSELKKKNRVLFLIAGLVHHTVS